jgi:hypothetical protein
MEGGGGGEKQKTQKISVVQSSQMSKQMFMEISVNVH